MVGSITGDRVPYHVYLFFIQWDGTRDKDETIQILLAYLHEYRLVLGYFWCRAVLRIDNTVMITYIYIFFYFQAFTKNTISLIYIKIKSARFFARDKNVKSKWTVYPIYLLLHSVLRSHRHIKNKNRFITRGKNYAVM